MAKKQKNEVSESLQLVLDLAKDESYDLLVNNNLSNVTEYIDTGCMPLNAIISGSLYGGIPKGRITILEGDSGCGKTLMIAKILANAQKMGLMPIILDSECAFDSSTGVNLGLDTSKCGYKLVETVIECRNTIFATLNKILENPELFGKYIFAIDSLGNLNSTKEIEDSEKQKTASDMGTKAKQLKAMLRALTYRLAKTGSTLIVSNHIFVDPSALHPSIVKNSSGGSGPRYISSVTVQMAAINEKFDKDKGDAKELIPGSKNIIGKRLKMMTIKNRVVPPFLTCKTGIKFTSGLSKYEGVIELAADLEIIKSAGSVWHFEGKSIGYKKDWSKNKEIMLKIIKATDEKCKEIYKYNVFVDDSDDFLNDMGDAVADEKLTVE
jgi:recombination protein RecA